MTVRFLTGDCLEMLRTLPDASVHCCMTSPPYFGLRDYGVAGQIGLEATPQAYVDKMVAVFREVRRVLRDDGTLWLNLGDSYAAHPGQRKASDITNSPKQKSNAGSVVVGSRSPAGLKPKDLIGIPWRVAFALQADGWYLRQWLPWVKVNPMPESTRDRPTTACEVVFMLTKGKRCYFDYEAVKRRMAPTSIPRLSQDVDNQDGSVRANGGRKANGSMKAVGGRADKQKGHGRRYAGFNDRWDQTEADGRDGARAFRNSDLFYDSLERPYGALFYGEDFLALDVATQPFQEAHFAVMPPRLCEPLIRASCPVKIGTVLDPFGGAGTTGLVADRLGRNAVLIELNPAYVELAKKRLADDAGLFADAAQ